MTDNENIDRLVSRRDALKLIGTGLAAVLLPSSPAMASEGGSGGNTAAMLYDATKCVGCRACETACNTYNRQPPQEPGEGPLDLSAYQWTVIKQYQEGSVMSFRKYQCMHCEHPACVSVCPVKAMQKLDFGPVVYDPKKCIGCRYCMVACPFHVPRIDWDRTLPEISKCNFCVERVDEGLIPACAEACPVGALTFGTRDEIVQEAHARIAQNPDLYIDHVYGEYEVGGTAWMYLSSIPFESLGFPEVECCPVAETSEAVATYGTPAALLVVAGMLGGVQWMSRRWRIDAEDRGERKEGA